MVRVAVADVQRLIVKAVKHPPDIWVVVDADHHRPFAAAHEVGHPLAVLERKVHAITSGLPVRRVRAMEGMGAVLTFSAFKPGKIFDVGTGQTLPSGREFFLDTQQVDGRGSGRRAERLTRDLAGKGMVLQVEESGGALDVGEGFGAGHFLPFEQLPRAERPFELAHELFEVVLHDAVKRD